jgi:hypothetical protein
MRLDKFYKQKITMWAITGGDDGQGKQAVAAPSVFYGRWEDKQEQFTDRTGQTTVSKAIIFFPEGIDLPTDTWVFNGVSTVADPTTLPDAYQVRIRSRTPDLRNLKSEQVAMI